MAVGRQSLRIRLTSTLADARTIPSGTAPDPSPRRRRTTWASVVQAEFLEGLCLEKIELELGQRFRRQRLNLLLDFGRQRAELGFH